MMMIVGSHYAIHGIMQYNDIDKALILWNGGNLVNKIFTAFLAAGAEVGTAVCFIISGYFWDSIKARSIARASMETIFH